MFVVDHHIEANAFARIGVLRTPRYDTTGKFRRGWDSAHHLVEGRSETELARSGNTLTPVLWLLRDRSRLLFHGEYRKYCPPVRTNSISCGAV